MDPHESELEAFRQAARDLGFANPDEDVDLPPMENGAEFVARMRAADARRARKRSVRRALVLCGSIAAASAVVFAIVRPAGTPASAENPPILSFEFASAARIAYAPGEAPRSILIDLAKAATAGGGPAGSGDVQYQRSDNWFAEIDTRDESKVVPQIVESWLRPDGSVTTHTSFGAALTKDGRSPQSNGGGGGRSVSETLEAGTVDPAFAENLSRRPSALATQLLRHADCASFDRGPVRSMCLYREVVALFQTYVIPGDLRSAIWAMLAGETTFTTLGSVSDRAGRDGVSVSIIDPADPTYRYILIIGPKDGQLLGTEDILIRRNADLKVDPPAVQAFTAILKSRYTDFAP